MKKLPQQISNLLSYGNLTDIVRSIKTSALIDRALCDGVVLNSFHTYYGAKTSADGNILPEERFHLRVNPTKAIIDVYRMVFLRDRAFHVELATTLHDRKRDVEELNLFINTIFDYINVAEIFSRALLTVLREGLCFLHVDIQENGVPLIAALSASECVWDQTSDKLSPTMQKYNYFAFQQYVPLSSVRLLYDLPNLEWADINYNGTPIFVNFVGTSNTTTQNSTNVQLENSNLREENKLCLITTFYERRVIDGNIVFRKQIIYNGISIIYEEDFDEIPVIPIYMNPQLELKPQNVTTLVRCAPINILSNIRQLLVTLNKIENVLYRYLQRHYSIFVANANVFASTDNASREDRPDPSDSSVLANSVLTTNLQKASDAFSVLYPSPLDPTLVQYYQEVWRKIYELTGVTPDLLGESTPNGNQQETDALFRSRNSLAIQRINLLLDRCGVAISDLALLLVRFLTNPFPYRKMATSPSLINRFIKTSVQDIETGDRKEQNIDPTSNDPNKYPWMGLFNTISSSTRRYYDTTTELMNLSIGQLMQSGVISPRALLHYMPWIDKNELQKIQQEEQQAANDANNIEAEKAKSDSQLRFMEIEERRESRDAKNRIDEMKILADLLMHGSENGKIHISRSMVADKFESLMKERDGGRRK
ncbi:MAG: hypothetical protein ACRCX2_05720 [Paraclostridium sp.]